MRASIELNIEPITKVKMPRTIKIAEIGIQKLVLSQAPKETIAAIKMNPMDEGKNSLAIMYFLIVFYLISLNYV